MPQWSRLSTFPNTIPNNPKAELSEQDKAFLVSALFYLEDRANWEDMDDATWDIVEYRIAEVAERVG